MNHSLIDDNDHLLYEDADGRKVYRIGFSIDGFTQYSNSYALTTPGAAPGTAENFLQFQNGNPAVTGVNGYSNEAVIHILIDRISSQNAKVACLENFNALKFLRSALDSLEARSKDRKDRGVTGQDVA